jgi:putative ABC transport system substrate-binding protein
MTAYKRVLGKFVQEKVDLIFVFPTEAALEAKTATLGTDIPVVFANVVIEGVSLINNVREPGGNMTGVRLPGPDIALKIFEVMQELAPKAKRVWIPYQRGYSNVPCQMEVLRPAAVLAGVTLIEFPVSTTDELKEFFNSPKRVKDANMDAMIFLAEPFAGVPDAFALISAFSSKHKLPMGGSFLAQGENGTIFSVNIDHIMTGKQAALLADKILKGAPAGTIAVVSAENFFQINCKAAGKIGVKLNEGLLARANRVIR